MAYLYKYNSSEFISPGIFSIIGQPSVISPPPHPTSFNGGGVEEESVRALEEISFFLARQSL